jgi:hypothetical protein
MTPDDRDAREAEVTEATRRDVTAALARAGMTVSRSELEEAVRSIARMRRELEAIGAWLPDDAEPATTFAVEVP